MFRFLAMFVVRRADNAENIHLKEHVAHLKKRLARHNEVTIPVLERKVELLEEINELIDTV